VDTLTIKEVTKILKTILNLKYFQYKENVYKPKTGIAMGSSLSGITAEIFIQNLEQPLLKYFLECEADIFIIYNQNRIMHKSVLKHFSKQHKAL
jgi:hypothetical protein